MKCACFLGCSAETILSVLFFLAFIISSLSIRLISLVLKRSSVHVISIINNLIYPAPQIAWVRILDLPSKYSIIVSISFLQTTTIVFIVLWIFWVGTIEAPFVYFSCTDILLCNSVCVSSIEQHAYVGLYIHDTNRLLFQNKHNCCNIKTLWADDAICHLTGSK